MEINFTNFFQITNKNFFCQFAGSWFCNCPPGFTGSLCERPVCATNPCRYGGTCLGSNTGPGFLCLCPVGRGGALCESGK